MTDTDFITAMQRDVPTIRRSPEAAPPEILKGNADLAINHPDAVGVQQEPPCAT